MSECKTYHAENVEHLQDQLAERTRERDEARESAKVLQQNRDDLRSSWHALNVTLSNVAKERDEARAERARLQSLSDELREEVNMLEEQLGERTAETWRLGTRGDEAEERVKKLEEALRFYAEPENWDSVGEWNFKGPVELDEGARARQALAKETT